MRLRIERPHDQDGVRDLHLRAFGDHGHTVNAIVDDLRPLALGDDGLSLVAEEDGAVVGHVLFTRGWLDTPRRVIDVQVLSPLAVSPDHQRRGIAAALVRRGHELLTERGVPLVFLEGSPAFYERFGFEPGAELGFARPSVWIPEAAFQALRLPAYEPWMTGALVYPDAFWAHHAVGFRESA